MLAQNRSRPDATHTCAPNLFSHTISHMPSLPSRAISPILPHLESIANVSANPPFFLPLCLFFVWRRELVAQKPTFVPKIGYSEKNRKQQMPGQNSQLSESITNAGKRLPPKFQQYPAFGIEIEMANCCASLGKLLRFPLYGSDPVYTHPPTAAKW